MNQKPHIKIINKPKNTFYESVLIAARNCYSSKRILEKEVLNMDIERGYELIKELWKAGHNTTFEHYYITFFMEGLSRHFVYKYLHYLTPYYSTDQQSQRYTEIKNVETLENFFYIPEIIEKADKEKWENFYSYLTSEYKQLTDEIENIIKEDKEYKFNKKIQRKKALELARYILPVGVKTKLTYTVNLSTLIKLLAYLSNLSKNDECYEEAVEFINEINRNLKKLFEKESLEYLEKYEKFYKEEIKNKMKITNFSNETDMKKFFNKISMFESNLNKLKYNKMFLSTLYENLFEISKNDYSIVNSVKINNEITLNNMSGLINELEKKENKVNVIKTFFPDIVKLEKEESNIPFSPLNYYETDRFVYTIGLLSHSAESQNQRHRTTRKIPINIDKYYDILLNKYYIPRLFEKENYKTILKRYKSIMKKIYDFFEEQRKKYGLNKSVYLLPNAQYLLIYNVDNLKFFKHKAEKRLCYNSQEEIWHFTFEQVKQLEEKYKVDIYKENLLPPCMINYKLDVKPFCPEGPRFCGIKVWKLSFDKMKRYY